MPLWSFLRFTLILMVANCFFFYNQNQSKNALKLTDACCFVIFVHKQAYVFATVKLILGCTLIQPFLRTEHCFYSVDRNIFVLFNCIIFTKRMNKLQSRHGKKLFYQTEYIDNHNILFLTICLAITLPSILLQFDI